MQIEMLQKTPNWQVLAFSSHNQFCTAIQHGDKTNFREKKTKNETQLARSQSVNERNGSQLH